MICLPLKVPGPAAGLVAEQHLFSTCQRPATMHEKSVREPNLQLSMVSLSSSRGAYPPGNSRPYN